MNVSHGERRYGNANLDRARRSSHTTKTAAPLKYSGSATTGGIRAPATALAAATKPAQASSVGKIRSAKKRSLARRQSALAIL